MLLYSNTTVTEKETVIRFDFTEKQTESREGKIHAPNRMRKREKEVIIIIKEKKREKKNTEKRETDT